MSEDTVDKKEDKGGFVNAMKRRISGEVEAQEDKEEKKEEKPKAKLDVKPKVLEEEKAPIQEEATPTTTKMVEARGAVLAGNPSMRRKHATVLEQKPVGARRYFRSK